MSAEMKVAVVPEKNRPIYRGYIAELEGFRAYGMTIIVLAHAWPGGSYLIGRTLQLGWALMDTFFVLSGFLIAGILLDTRMRPDYFRSYYIRRCLRIFPVYYAVITIVTAVVIFSGSLPTMVKDWGSPWWFFVYLGNIPSAIWNHFPAYASYSPLWSLQVEEQFYLLFPLLIYRLSFKTLKRVLICLGCLSPLLRVLLYWWAPGNVLAAYVLFPCRMEGLALGALIAIRFREGPWKIS